MDKLSPDFPVFGQSIPVVLDNIRDINNHKLKYRGRKMRNLITAGFCLLATLIVINKNAVAQTQNIGRISYSVQALAPVHIPSPHEYVGLRLKIDQFGSGGILSVQDPTVWDQIVGMFGTRIQYVFVGLRFTNGPFELLPSSATKAGDPIIPFFTVLHAQTGTIVAGQPQTEDGDLILGPREVGSGDVALQLSAKWGDKIAVTIPTAVYDAAQAAVAAYVKLPAALVNAGMSNKILPADRDEADKFFSNALSFDSADEANNNGPSGINTVVISNAQLKAGVDVHIEVYDRAATSREKKLIVAFDLISEYLPSVLPNTPDTFPANGVMTSFYQNWDPNSPILTGDLTTSVQGLLGQVPTDAAIGSPSGNMAAGANSFGSACTKLESYFGGLGFNQYDQYALAWATLKQSGYLSDLRTKSAADKQAADTTQSSYLCPGDAINTQFARVGLPPILTVHDIATNRLPNQVTAKTKDMRATLYKLAHDWAVTSATALQEYFTDPDQHSQFNFVRDKDNILSVLADGPMSGTELAAALQNTSPRIGSFGVSQSQANVWCVTFTTKQKAFAGNIVFNPENAKIIDEINMSTAPSDCVQ